LINLQEEYGHLYKNPQLYSYPLPWKFFFYKKIGSNPNKPNIVVVVFVTAVSIYKKKLEIN
jgi:hypothetical protein